MAFNLLDLIKRVNKNMGMLLAWPHPAASFPLKHIIICQRVSVSVRGGGQSLKVEPVLQSVG